MLFHLLLLPRRAPSSVQIRHVTTETPWALAQGAPTRGERVAWNLPGPRSEIKRRTAPTVFGQIVSLSRRAVEPKPYEAAATAFCTASDTFNGIPGAMVL